MADFFKKFIIGHFLILVIVALAIMYFGGSQLIAIFLFAGLIESLFYYLDVKFIPKRKAEIADKLIKTFGAEQLLEGIIKFNIGSIEFYAEAAVDFKLGLQLANFETVRFHVARNQIDRLSTISGFELKENKIYKIETYIVYETDVVGLRRAKEKLEKMI